MSLQKLGDCGSRGANVVPFVGMVSESDAVCAWLPSPPDLAALECPRRPPCVPWRSVPSFFGNLSPEGLLNLCPPENQQPELTDTLLVLLALLRLCSLVCLWLGVSRQWDDRGLTNVEDKAMRGKFSKLKIQTSENIFKNKAGGWSFLPKIFLVFFLFSYLSFLYFSPPKLQKNISSQRSLRGLRRPLFVKMGQVTPSYLLKALCLLPLPREEKVRRFLLVIT